MPSNRDYYAQYFTYWDKTPAVLFDRGGAKETAEEDEKHLKGFIKGLSSCIICSLGVGTGRELDWLSKLENVHEVIGVDRSQNMLNFVHGKANTTLKTRFVPVLDDFREPSQLGELVKRYKHPIVYLSLDNTFGNCLPEDYITILSRLMAIMKPSDYIGLVVYKRGYPVDKDLRWYLEYEGYRYYVRNEYGIDPTIYYDEKSHNIVCAAGERVFQISHRFTPDELRAIITDASLELVRLDEGPRALTAIAKPSSK